MFSGAAGAIAGKTSVARGETELGFTPGASWKAGDCELIVSTDIEDLWGNKIGYPFNLGNIGAFERVRKGMDLKTISLLFIVRWARCEPAAVQISSDQAAPATHTR